MSRGEEVFTGIFVLRIRVCTNIGAHCRRGKLCSSYPISPIGAVYRRHWAFKTTVYSRMFEFPWTKKQSWKGPKINVQTISFCQSPSIVARKVCKLKIQWGWDIEYPAAAFFCISALLSWICFSWVPVL